MSQCVHFVLPDSRYSIRLLADDEISTHDLVVFADFKAIAKLSEEVAHPGAHVPAFFSALQQGPLYRMFPKKAEK